ncbi:MAG: adenylosuccinate lyase [Chloroflexi bacterium]|nr:adenylosuccinate lyase [Chloroflexota bacterium]MYA92375.1 adenylosuccinate lyase [Chloroflexota bacterium]MYD39238.1 adenylosuccinate lyase [Chloroflexota bacterium]MYE79412.1 adenylosuccinate lyase [Chloroflexota bacterium]MYI41924.1 adenylosuccinate lyase [Chloroflexota bacterium]
MSLWAVSPLDGRYADKTAPLREYLSEWALIKYRALVQLRWLRAMSAQPGISHVRAFTPAEALLLEKIESAFDQAAAERVKAIEALTNHDSKAVEYYLRERLEATSLADVAGSLHFACTSDDINNLAYGLMLRGALHEVWQPAARELLGALVKLARDTAATPMLARTHGQAATPTSLGKEITVFVYRLRRQLRQIEAQDYLGKFNGAVGAYNAHIVAYPDLDWLAISRQFVQGLGLTHNPLSTQIEAHDYLAELAHGLMRFNTALLDMCHDMWSYISLGYFRQQVVAGETGSSTMPHKVNPIDFENAEANLGISNALFAHLADKLPISRLQRDLSDSSALRNFGVAIGHSYLALLTVRRGLGKLDVDAVALAADLDNNWQLLAEAVQTVMRKHHLPEAYEQLKALTRGQPITRERLHGFIQALELPAAEKQRLLQLTPATYLGLAGELAALATKEAAD